MANRNVNVAAGAATRPAQTGESAPGAVETAIATAATVLLPAPARDGDAVHRLAYTYYEERGRVDGHDLEDWLRAEAALGAADAGR